MDSHIANPPLPHGIDLYRAIYKDGIAREANSMASSNPLPSSRVAPVTQSDYLGLTTHPAIELGPPRQKRRLEYVKCDFCRRSKKKCEPSERQWPGEKCQRCIAKGFTCSAPAKKDRGVSDPAKKDIRISEAISVDRHTLLTRSEQDRLHEQRAYCALAKESIQQMSRGLGRNICKLSTINSEISTIHRSEVDDVLPEELQYACRFWVLHLFRGKDKFLVDVDLQIQVYNLLTRYFLCWFEALSLLQLMHDGIDALETLECLVNNMQATTGAKLRGVVQDAKCFILDYGSDIKHFPLNIYSNALQHSRSCSMKEIHIPRPPAWSDSHSGEVRGTLTTTLDGYTNPVPGIAFSPDGKLLATAAIDGKVRLWALATRKSLRVLSHNNHVNTIAFSPDGNVLACAVNNNALYWVLKLWNPTTGRDLQTRSPIESVGFVTSIAFSPDGKLIASNTSDEIRLWDPTTGSLLRVFQHGSNAHSIAFSPDGRLLASAWADGVIKLWNLHTGCEVRTFVENNDSTPATASSPGSSTMAFSPDSQLLALAPSKSTAINIWDPATGIKLQKLVGHTLEISSVTFSPDGRLLASASADDTIKFWDPITGTRQGTLLMRHSRHTIPLAFSPDGNLLACATGSLSIFGLEDNGGVDLWELHNHK